MTQHGVTPKRSRFRFIGDIIAEMKKVTWLKWPREVLYLTFLVLAVTVAVALILGAFDYGFGRLVSDFFVPGK